MNIKSLLVTIDGLVSDEKIHEALEKSAEHIEDRAKSKCPVRTGKLQNSITHEVKGNTASVYTDVPYGKYVEYGTGVKAEKDPTPGYWVYIDAEFGPHPPKLTHDKYTYYKALMIKQWLVETQGVPEHYVHITDGSKPHPFMRPALDAEEIKNIFTEVLNGR